MLVTGLESRSMLMIKNGIKIYANETMGLLDECQGVTPSNSKGSLPVSSGLTHWLVSLS